MDFYITDRTFTLLEVISTAGNTDFKVITADDVSTLETSSRRMTMDVSFTPKTTGRAKQSFKVGNYVLYTDLNGKQQWQTIMKATHNPLTQIRTLELESAGLDLLNETTTSYKADTAKPIAFYINYFTYDSGWDIGINEISKLTRKLEWEAEATALERILSVAKQFDNAELEFRFDFVGNELHKRYIDIRKKRGTTDHHRLYVNRDINSIVVNEDIYELVNAIYATGGTLEGSDKPVNLIGYNWTDPDGRFTLSKQDGIIRDTKNVKQWSRLNRVGNYFVQHKQYETTDKNTLINNVIGHLKKYSEPMVSYDVDIANIPDMLVVGDTIELVDENEQLYLSSRVQELRFDYTTGLCEATLSDFVRLQSGIDERLRDIEIKINNKTEQMFNSVPQVFVQPDEPVSPKEKDIWWVQTEVEKKPEVLVNNIENNITRRAMPTMVDDVEKEVMITSYKVFRDGVWEEQTIDQSILNIETLNAVNMNGSIINGSKFINTWNNKGTISGGQVRRQGTTTIEGGAILQDNDTYITQTGSTVEKLRSEESTLIQYGQVLNTVNNYDVESGTKIERKSNGLLSANRVYLNELDYRTANKEINQQATLEPKGLNFTTVTKEGSNPAVITGTTDLSGGLIKVNGFSPNISMWGQGTNTSPADSGTLLKFGGLEALGFNTSVERLNGLVQRGSGGNAFVAMRDARIKFQGTILLQGHGEPEAADYAYTKMEIRNSYAELADKKTNTQGGTLLYSAIGTFGNTNSVGLQWVGTATAVIDVKAGQWFGVVLELNLQRNNLFATRLVNVVLEEMQRT